MRRAGVTLVELLVVLAILGVMAGVAGLSFARPVLAVQQPGSLEAALDSIAEVRRMAITRGVSITVTLSISGSTAGGGDAPWIVRATALPDGSIIADAALGIDRLTGRPVGSQEAREHE